MHACVHREFIKVGGRRLIMDSESQQQRSLHGGRQVVDSFAIAPLDDGAAAPEEAGGRGVAGMVDYMLGHSPPPPPASQVSLDKLSFSDSVLQFADFGPKLALNQPAAADRDDNVDDEDGSYFLRFQSGLPSLPVEQGGSKKTADVGGGGVTTSDSTTQLVQRPDGHDGRGGGGRTGDHRSHKGGGGEQGKSGGRRKRPRTMKTSEEVESQRMTHIAVERNRRRHMNEYLRVLRSLMPGSYVQRGDQASIIGGAIEFIRELEQLIQCLESQKRRRLYGSSGDAPAPASRPVAEAPPAAMQQGQAPPPFYPTSLPFLAAPSTTGGGGSDAGAAKALDLDAGGGVGLRGEEVVENKSCVADIEVRVAGADAMIKILSRRRAGQLIRIIAAIEDMHMSILHTNITTIEQTVLYSFNVKVAGEATFSAEDIAGAVHQILSFIDVNYSL